MIEFKLAFDPSLIPVLATRYDYADDTQALRAGARIRNGEYTRVNLLKIIKWKNGRGVSHLKRNSDDEIADALNLAVAAKTDRAAAAVLTALHGVQVPVASAILTTIDPERFTIIDFRALEALGVKKSNITIDFYLSYLKQCRKLARINKVPLRELDRALWQWSKEKSKNTGARENRR